jgi:phenylpropionate dioxygenase-like ring-hydroxylating dioxygenase large terminal subunit
MFIHQSCLEYLLAPEQYFSAAQHRLELEQLFLPGWHLLATQADLPKDGDFVTLDLFDHPLLLRNCHGEFRAFLNVCAHRHCRLTHVARGNSPRLRCQYHGWEYTKEGRAGRIPDARCFRPFDRENSRLKAFRTETCGQLIFVCLQEDAPSLSEYLGPYRSYCEQSFASPFRQAWSYDGCYDANWKIVIENSLESYHVPCLHPTTIGEIPPEQNCEHELTERYTRLKTPESSRVSQLLGWYLRSVKVPLTLNYMHHHLHPDMIFSSEDVFHMVQVVVPTSPTTCQHRAWLFTARGENPGWTRELLGQLIAFMVTHIARRILLEDKPIFADVQRGIEASPFRGVIGTREERVFVFQKYVLDRCGLSARRSGTTTEHTQTHQHSDRRDRIAKSF